MKLALIQMQVKNTPEENLLKAKELLKKAVQEKIDLAVFPEMFACPYDNSCFPRFAMDKDDTFLAEIGNLALEYGIYIVAGSVPEKFKKNIYNTSFVFDPKGHRIASHRKMHLFDINVEGGQRFMESDVLTPGDDFTTFDTPWGKLGLIICYDIRFPELARLLALQGAKGIIVPAAFNMTTGPAHWELTFRARALDNQLYMAGVAPARDTTASYVAWGHTISTDPWGKVLIELEEKEEIAFVEWDLEYLEKVRRELPLLKHRRTDLYRLTNIANNGEFFKDKSWKKS
ncbi:carbon-nitrogen hydrolase family protein [Anaerotignum sp.]|uniref:carbon-nitrogen hydrolase family protein n=1 Tax=Anaerotignum sp. TaxID=2039241 RepID=UPI00271515C8|nr:carbon-nitrogen hydrolase family protein [Anaerotignum sp.]